MGKKSDTQDAVVRLCLNRSESGSNLHIFSNIEVKEISSQFAFANHNDVTHIDTLRGLSPLMKPYLR